MARFGWTRQPIQSDKVYEETLDVCRPDASSCALERFMEKPTHKFLLIVVLALGLHGCSSAWDNGLGSLDDVPDVSYYRNDQVLAEAKAQFKEKNYGKSYALYKRAIELYPNDVSAWLGYGASSDMIGRFDNSDIAYRRLAKMLPNKAVYENNIGYSYVLRGKLGVARRHFLKAYEIDPANQTTLNNLELLKNSVAHAERG